MKGPVYLGGGGAFLMTAVKFPINQVVLAGRQKPILDRSGDFAKQKRICILEMSSIITHRLGYTV